MPSSNRPPLMMIQGGGHLGEEGRGPERVAQHVAAQPDAPGDRRARGHGRPRLEDVAGRIGNGQQMIDEVDRVKAEIVADPRGLADARPPVVGLAQERTEADGGRRGRHRDHNIGWWMSRGDGRDEHLQTTMRGRRPGRGEPGASRVIRLRTRIPRRTGGLAAARRARRARQRACRLHSTRPRHGDAGIGDRRAPWRPWRRSGTLMSRESTMRAPISSRAPVAQTSWDREPRRRAS